MLRPDDGTDVYPEVHGVMLRHSNHLIVAEQGI